MSDINQDEQAKWHRRFAVDCYNGTWDLLDKPDRTPEEDLRMIHMAHASRYHWGQIGTALEFARGEWQISRVYAVLRHGDAALRHAKASLKLCQENGIGDFDLAFAYEAMTRAKAVLGNASDAADYLALATEAGQAIEDKGNRDYYQSELATAKMLLP